MKAVPGPPDWISISAFALKYGVDRTTVHKWVRLQILETYRVGRLIRVRNLTPDRHFSTRPVDNN